MAHAKALDLREGDLTPDGRVAQAEAQCRASIAASAEPPREARAFALAMASSMGAILLAVASWHAMLALQIRLTPGGEQVATAGPPIDQASVERGRMAFVATCSACHGPGATGVQGLGKDLVHSRFVGMLDDEHLAAFVKRGRDVNDPLNTTKIPMPPKGGNPALSDEQLADIVAFVRGLREPGRVVAMAQPANASTSDAAASGGDASAAEEAASLLAQIGQGAQPDSDSADETAQQAKLLLSQLASGQGGDAAADNDSNSADENDPAAMVERGKTLFTSCTACHGPDGRGLKGLGKDLVHSTFAMGLSDADLLAFVKRGRDTSDPLNTTKVAMPPRGGNPALDDNKLKDVIAYVRSLQKAGANAAQ